ncbi:MAG: glycosyltransferase [Chitinophagales bacterium]|nr:glycosyltransferase [Chitinophagales bacterium]
MRPKVLFLTRWYPNRVDKLDGNFIENHARAVAMYCDLAVLYVGADPGMSHKKYDWEVKEEFGFPVVRVWYRNNDVGKTGFARVIKFFRYLRATRIGWKLIHEKFGVPQISHVHIFTRPVLLAFYLQWRYGAPYLMTEHSSHFVHELPRWLPPKKQFAQFSARRAKFITVVSETLQKAITDFGLHGRYAIVPNVVFTPALSLTSKDETAIRIVAIGGLTDERKNITGLINVFSQAHEQLPQTSLHIVRPVPDQQLMDAATNTGLFNSKIFFHDYLPNEEVYQLLANSSFLVVNSLSETFSMSAAEALACGKPVITTRCGGPEEFVSEERGRLINVNEPAQLKEALIWMRTHYRDFDPQKLKSFIRENYSPEVVGKKFLGLYELALGK